MVLRVSAGALLILALWHGGAVRAAEIARSGEGRCIATIAETGTEAARAAGIATPSLAATVLAQSCDGGWLRVALGEGGLALSALPEGAATPPRRAAIEIDSEALPDGEVTQGQGILQSAWLSGPSDIYAHGILGDRIEARELRALTREGRRLTYSLDRRSVFEDRRVRLIDLDGDGREELLVIRSYLDRGAALAVFAVTAEAIVPRGESTPIGLAHRWLNPAGVADFDDDGRLEIAYVETPHIGGTLRLVSLGPDGLVEEMALSGFSNHAIGSRELDLAAVIDWNGDGVPDLALPDAARRRMVVVGFAGGFADKLTVLAHDAEVATAVIASDLDADGRPELVYGLADGTLVLVRP